MISFAVIAEGITDQVVIEQLISTVIEDGYNVEVDVTQLQPAGDETDAARQAIGSFGGFENVLNYCADASKIHDALAFNHFLVIQIDTDRCDHPRMNVNVYRDGEEIDDLTLVEDVKNLIIENLTPDVYEEHRDRIIFAVSVHSTECWLLPFFEKDLRAKSQSKACERRLERALKKQNLPYKKDGPTYRKLCREMRKSKVVKESCSHSPSMACFIEFLENLVLAHPNFQTNLEI